MPLQATAALDALTASTELGELAYLPEWRAITPEVVVPAIRQLLADSEARFEALEAAAPETWDGLMLPLEEINDDLGSAIGRISHLLGVAYSDELQAAYDEVRPDYVALANRMSQSVSVYQAMKALQASAEGSRLSTARTRILSESIRRMERSGVHLGDEDKARYQALSTELSELSNRFRSNLVSEEKASRVIASDPVEVAGVPAAILEMAAARAVEDGVEGANSEAGPWHFVVNAVNYAVVTNGDHRELRERFYRAYRGRGTSAEHDNRGVLERMLRLRQEQAALVGFDNYAELSLDAKMAPSVDDVESLYADMERVARPVAEQELESLAEFAAANGGPAVGELEPWDIAYWSEKQQEALYGYDSEQLRQYFPLPVAVDGLFALIEDLYGATFEEVTDGSVPVWHDDVRFYRMLRDGNVVAGFYFDPFARPGLKRGGAWMNTVVDRSSRLAPAGREASAPIGFMIQNARPPANGQPALMSLDEVRTLFHEFGHLTQLLFTDVNEAAASGINLVEWDTVELASQFNELWMDHAPFLKQLTRHVDTGQPLDDETIERVIASRNYLAGNGILGQLQLGKADLLIHQRYGVADGGDNRSPFEMEQDVIASTRVLPWTEGDSSLPAFTHLFSGAYAAGYYSYLWAEVLATDAFAAFREVGLDNREGVREVARRFEDSVLSLGGSKPAAEVYRLFRGRDATPDALLESQGLLQNNG